MIRGTTPTLEFTLPFGTELLAEAWVTLAQGKTEVLTKELRECTCGDNTLTVRLTQEETLLLNGDRNVEIQVRVRLNSGDALASDIIHVAADRILKDGVI